MYSNDSNPHSGEFKINWAQSHMPLLRQVGEHLNKTNLLSGKKITMSIHLEAKTAVLASILQQAGAQVFATGSNPLSTQDDVCAALAQRGVEVFAAHGASDQEYHNHLVQALSIKPDIFIDDGGDLISLLKKNGDNLTSSVHSVTEEVDMWVANKKLESFGVVIGSWTKSQRNYIMGSE